MATSYIPEARAGPRVRCETCCRRKRPRARGRSTLQRSGQPRPPPPGRYSPGSAGRATREAAWLPSDIRSAAGSLRPCLRGLKVSPVEFPSDHVHRPEGGDHIGDHIPGEEFVQSGHDRKARRTDSHAVWAPGSVAHDVETEFSVGSFHWKVDLSFGRPHSVAEHDQLELLHEPFDVAVGVLLGREEDSLFLCGNGRMLGTTGTL